MVKSCLSNRCRRTHGWTAIIHGLNLDFRCLQTQVPSFQSNCRKPWVLMSKESHNSFLPDNPPGKKHPWCPYLWAKFSCSLPHRESTAWSSCCPAKRAASTCLNVLLETSQVYEVHGNCFNEATQPFLSSFWYLLHFAPSHHMTTNSNGSQATTRAYGWGIVQNLLRFSAPSSLSAFRSFVAQKPCLTNLHFSSSFNLWSSAFASDSFAAAALATSSKRLQMGLPLEKLEHLELRCTGHVSQDAASKDWPSSHCPLASE